MKRSAPMRRSKFPMLTYAEVVTSRQPAKKRKPMTGVKRDRADHFFSLYVRYRDNWRCQRCLAQYEPVTNALHCSHFWGRARESTRFDPVNCVAHCHGCHAFFTANPELHRQWKLSQIGQAEYDRLMIRAETRQKKDRALMAIVYKSLYEKEKQRFEQLAT